MKYSDVKDLIEEKVRSHSEHIDKEISSKIQPVEIEYTEKIQYAEKIKQLELRKYRIRCLYDFAEYNNEMPKIQVGDNLIVQRANLVNYLLFENYIKADTLYCGVGVISYLKLFRDYWRDESEYEVKDEMFNCGILYGMKIKCLPSNIIPEDEFVYINKENDEIIKYKIEGTNREICWRL